MASSGLNKNMLDILIFSNKLTLYNVKITVTREMFIGSPMIQTIV